MNDVRQARPSIVSSPVPSPPSSGERVRVRGLSCGENFSNTTDSLKRSHLFSGCHGHGFAWPCFCRREDTATQSRDRGTQRVYFPADDSSINRLSKSPLTLALSPEDEGEGTGVCLNVLSLLFVSSGTSQQLFRSSR